ncbi:MAG: hypothetical protein GWN84_05770, partial [Gammaproteobacteria bacterium]|nr:hypothetical protein [Gammaproteobacteria bacterium]NIR82486.1 hypothetical protein [Gammaproteobacteria bacterium]NIR88482.1 hypothetical protein [Gammaproteobacteria bacterium]NIU03622.1 hypothetical protein [Gammaproteobacteria bacterium]NIV50974.1 hypothetical protein [Gammaproteobacteria bacterium]
MVKEKAGYSHWLPPTHWLPRTLILVALLGGPPLLGAWLTGRPLERYLRFPPELPATPVPGFDWMYFALLCALLLAVVGPVIARLFEAGRGAAVTRRPARAFPAWGWLGVAMVAAGWVLAWNRFAWFAPMQQHTFAPLWVGYIVVVNALAAQRTGRCMLADHTRDYLLLFPLSALFWWFFEYLNRFVGNWYYVGIDGFGPWEYALFATISFSTVLPAVVATRDWLASFPRLYAGLERFRPVPPAASHAVATAALVLGVAGLAGLAVWPTQLFPLVWMGPLLVVVALQTLAGEDNVLSSLSRGDWRPLWLPALAALLCGFFWEMWNIRSLAHWEYAIPYTHRFQIFEMPLLGYAGYLPFGITC